MKRRGYITIVGAVLAAGLPLVVWAQQTPPKDAGAKPEARAPAQAKAQTYKIDPVHSSVVFRIKHLDITYFYGRFNEVGGTVVLNEADPAACAIEAEVKVESLDTHNADRDKHLKSPAFFDVEKNPLIAFKSTGFKKTGEQTYEVQGNLTLHGVTKPLTVKLERTGAGPGMKGEFRAGFETEFTVKRTEFGMTSLVGPVGDEVRLTVSLETIRQ
jgi:polyisoprenoid-binding protein YceI